MQPLGDQQFLGQEHEIHPVVTGCQTSNQIQEFSYKQSLMSSGYVESLELSAHAQFCEEGGVDSTRLDPVRALETFILM